MMQRVSLKPDSAQITGTTNMNFMNILWSNHEACLGRNSVVHFILAAFSSPSLYRQQLGDRRASVRLLSRW